MHALLPGVGEFALVDKETGFTTDWYGDWDGIMRGEGHWTAWGQLGYGEATYQNWCAGQPDNYDDQFLAVLSSHNRGARGECWNDETWEGMLQRTVSGARCVCIQLWCTGCASLI